MGKISGNKPLQYGYYVCLNILIFSPYVAQICPIFFTIVYFHCNELDYAIDDSQTYERFDKI